MVIQIDGSSGVNKGAQLMLVAVLQEIKQKHPDAKIIVNNNYETNKEFIKNLYGNNFRIRRNATFCKIVNKFDLVRVAGWFSRKLARLLTDKNAIKGVDVCLNIGGFQFGDQWDHNDDYVSNWRDYLRKQHLYGTISVFMPQAFGPFYKLGSKNILNVLNENADIIIARDDVSYKYLEAESVDKAKVFQYPDFTASVQPKETEYSKKYSGKICIIPNSKIFKTGTMDRGAYIESILAIVDHVYDNGQEVLLLNHEGVGDLNLCKQISEKSTHELPVITGLDALETKGVIAASYFVISSRFHGVANSLSSCVPCLATSWSHKYQKLLEEYKQEEYLINLSDLDSAYKKIDVFLNKEGNKKTRGILEEMNIAVIAKNREMWDMIWSRV